MNTGLILLLQGIYRGRPCWICGGNAWCGHREPLVDLAEVSVKKRKEDTKV